MESVLTASQEGQLDDLLPDDSSQTFDIEELAVIMSVENKVLEKYFALEEAKKKMIKIFAAKNKSVDKISEQYKIPKRVVKYYYKQLNNIPQQKQILSQDKNTSQNKQIWSQDSVLDAKETPSTLKIKKVVKSLMKP